MLLERFAGTPEDELLDRLVVSPALAGPELDFLHARLAERRGDVSLAATLVTGDRHAAAQRNLFGRLLGCLYHCLTTGCEYDEATAFPATHRENLPGSLTT
jgi:hypothetical protein